MSAAPQSADLTALTRALVFTRDTYQTLRSRVAPRKSAKADPDATLSLSIRRGEAPFEAPAARPDALTPWDLIDEEDAREGVTFSIFQRRLPEAAPGKAAA